MITRAQLRDLVRQAITCYPQFEGHRVAQRWGQDVGEADLPAIGVFTPKEEKRRVAVGEYTRETDVVVLIRRKAASALEDLLDDDSEILAELLVRDLEKASKIEDFEYITVQTDIPGSGEQRIGSAYLTFRALQYTSEPG